MRRGLVFGQLCLIMWAAACALLAEEGKYRLAATSSTVHIGYFDARIPPALRVRSGDTVEIQTLAAGGLAAWQAARLPTDQVEPALREVMPEVKDASEYPHLLTGPVWVEGAQPGDVLEVKILAVDLVFPYGWNAIMPGRGVLPDDFPYEYFRLTPIDLTRKVAKFAEGIELPLRPFFGVMGVAPPVSAGRISSGPPWIHTGNMDNKDLVAGTTLYLPVHTRGALFSIGDAHAAQADGEVNVAALETVLTGTFQFFVHKGKLLRWPRAETPTHYMTMGFHENLEEAGKIALREMLDFLVTEKGLTRDDAYLLSGSAVDLHVTQVVDGRKGIHATVAKGIFPSKP